MIDSYNRKPKVADGFLETVSIIVFLLPRGCLWSVSLSCDVVGKSVVCECGSWSYSLVFYG